MATLFTDEDIMSWFCVTNPLPKMREDAVLPVAASTLVPDENLLRKKEREAAEEAKKRACNPPPLVNARRGRAATQESYYERVRRLEEASTQFGGIDSDIFKDDIGPGLPFNPNAQPGDDDFDPQLLANHSVYKTCSFDVNLTPPLPIAAHRNAIVRTIESNSVTVIQGETGSGKSTQVAQYILDHHQREDTYCNIVCTQPRRIAATSIAK